MIEITAHIYDSFRIDIERPVNEASVLMGTATKF